MVPLIFRDGWRRRKLLKLEHISNQGKKKNNTQMHNSLEDECGRDLPTVEWERICFGGVSRKDEKETGLGATLNLGHTSGYAIETKGGNGQWLHGEAVAAGMVMAVDLSHRLGWIDDSSVQRVHAILKQANLPTAPPENMTVDMFKSVMMVMMIREGVDEGMAKLILPRGPLGNCVVTRDYDRNALDATLHKFCKS